MRARERFAPRAELGERLGVTAHRGVDLLTGLPVLTYRFAGPPRPGAERLESPHLPGVLASEVDDSGQGLLVTAISAGYRPLEPERDTVDALDVRAAMRALRDAARAGVTHGDLHPGRLWRGADGHLLVEGFGAPWGRDASHASDVRAMAASLAALGAGLPGALRAALERAQGDASADAAALQQAAEDAASDVEAAGLPVGGERAAADPEPIEVGPDPPRTRAGEREEPTTDFVKDLPPGGAYRSGGSQEPVRPGAFDVLADESPPARRSLRLPILVGLLVLTAAGAAVVTFMGQDAFAPPAAPVDPGLDQAEYVVDVRVTPDDAPPLQLVVVDGPGGSELTPGTELGRAPRRVVLDRAGRWVLQGRFGSERTRTATLQVPETRSVTLEWVDDAP